MITLTKVADVDPVLVSTMCGTLHLGFALDRQRPVSDSPKRANAAVEVPQPQEPFERFRTVPKDDEEQRRARRS